MKKRKLFEETSTPINKSMGFSPPIQRNTRSMAKQTTVPHMPSLQGEPMDIPNSPEKGSGYGATISEIEGLVTKNLRGMRKEKEA
jgi:hypothetical protein